MATRDLDAARGAFAEADALASRLAHSRPTENHSGEAGETIQSVVFGGLDGIITTFAVVIAAAASNLSYGAVFVIGFANLLADALGMGVGDYLSSRAEEDHEAAEEARERREIEELPEEEKQEMVDIYVNKGMAVEDAREVVELLFPHREAFLSIMMLEELSIQQGSGESSSALKSGIVTFFAFMVCGGLPLVPLVFAFGHYSDPVHFADPLCIVSIALFAVTLFALGCYKGVITGTKWYYTGPLMLINGSLTTALAYALGTGFEMLVNKAG